MEQYEYRSYEFHKGRIFYWEDSSQIDELNDLGKDGWEVVFIEGVHCLLKRKLSD